MKPILFNTPMVRAILDGGKTQTRRIVKGQIKEWDYLELSDYVTFVKVDKWGDEHYKDVPGTWASFQNCHEYASEDYPFVKSQYQIGDILYVRETWGTYSPTYGTVPKLYYRADDNAQDGIKWRPSIHMPKSAARIFLRVTGVKVERLQDITFEDCCAEGIYDDYKTISEAYHRLLAEKAYPKQFKKYGTAPSRSKTSTATVGTLILGYGYMNLKVMRNNENN